VEDFLSGGSGNFVRVRSPEAEALATMLEAQGVGVSRQADGALRITGASPDSIGALARLNRWTLQELSTHRASLEQRYMELTNDSVDYRTAKGALRAIPHAGGSRS
jgi:ABC-2 type transport system ATP-binding protein